MTVSSTTLINPADETVIGEVAHTSLEQVDEAVARAVVAGVDVVVGRSSRREPLCAVWATGAAGRVRAAFDRGTRSIHGVLDDLDTEDVRLSMQAVRNINTPDDLDQ